MAEKKELTKDERIAKEKRRLNRIYKEIDDKRKNTVEGLIDLAAYQRVTLEEFKEDLDKNGFTEWFQQGKEQAAYERKRPIADMYNSLSNSYQKTIKQLTDLLPKEDAGGMQASDGFDEFVERRKEMK